MNRITTAIALFLVFSILPLPEPAAASSVRQPPANPNGQAGTVGIEPYAGAHLCLPGVYTLQPSGCLPLGPSTYLTQMAQMGITFPLRALPAYKPDAGLSVMTEQYLSVKSDGIVPLYGSLEDAETHSPSGSLAGGRGLKYLAVMQRVDNDQGIFFQLMSGEWINAADEETACCTSMGRFQGLLFRQAPSNRFGWVLTPVKARTGPGYEYPETGEDINRETVIQVYSSVEQGNTRWLLIGVDTWLDAHYAGLVTLNSTPPEGVDNNRWIEVNLGEQTLSVYDESKLVFATLIATGVKPFYTRPGLFKIYKKKELETMSGAFEADKSDYYYLEDVPWTMYFDEARALHGAYWRTLYGYAASHGCVNLSPGDAHWLFDWANEGDYVYVWDPTGQTPTDPKYYGSGGA